jgi:Domain of unknown function (DUF4214)
LCNRAEAPSVAGSAGGFAVAFGGKVHEPCAFTPVKEDLMSIWLRPRSVAIWLLAAVLLAGVMVAAVPRPAAAAGVVPGQYIAKLYSEGLGRAPDQTGWTNMIAFFQANGCSASTLAQKGEQIYTSAEFTGLGYDNAAQLLALYRGALNREPDSSGFNFYLNKLSSGTSWATVADDIFTSSEFTGDATAFCTQGPYYFGGGTAITIPLGQGCSGQFCFTGGTQAQLQAMLNSAAATGATVTLAQQVVVQITTTQTIGPPRQRLVGLNIPAGVTLTTAGQPGPNRYAQMGRLVRAPSFGETSSGAGAVVEVDSGAKLENVWVDGQRASKTDSQSATVNVETAGGSGTTVTSDRMTDAIGFTNLHALGTAESLPCASNMITGNLSTQYATDHVDTGDWSDGLSVACENATVTGNTVIDATDVGIVLFRAYPAVQKSLVKNNTVLNAGNSAFGGIVADPLSSTPTVSPSFAGSSVTGNTLWTGPGASYGIGLSLGTAAWFSSPNIATGASFTSNTLSGNVTEGMTVSGMLNVTATGNTINVTLGQFVSCPKAEIAVDPQYGSGNIQSPITSVQVRHCI